MSTLPIQALTQAQFAKMYKKVEEAAPELLMQFERLVVSAAVYMEAGSIVAGRTEMDSLNRREHELANQLNKVAQNPHFSHFVRLMLQCGVSDPARFNPEEFGKQ